MSTNIIDAFIVTFGLDARSYKTGERDVRDGLKRTREDAKKTFDEFETRGAKGGQALRSLANEAAGFFLLLAGASTIKSFASNLIGGEAAAGRLSETIGVSTSRLYAWQEAVKQVGGSEGDASGALQRIATAIQSYKLTGTTGMDADLRGLGITNSDIMSKDPSEILLKMAAAGERLGKPEFAARLQRIGIPQSTIYLLEKGRGSLEDLLKTTEDHANITDRDVKAAQAFEAAMAALSTTIGGQVLPVLTPLVEGLNDLLTNADGATAKMLGLGQSVGMVGRKWTLFMAEIKAAKDGDWSRFWSLIKQDWTDTTGTTRNGMTPGGNAGGALIAPIRIAGGTGARGGGGGGGGAPVANSADSYIQNYLRRSGFTAEQSRGILAGIRAEGGSLGMAANGAFGIGQWRGDRQRNLMRQYGRAPSLEQQMAFMVGELRGGDRGGPVVGRQATADHTLLAYITQFMRPGPGTMGDIRRGRQYLGSHGGGGTTIGTINIHTKATDARGIAGSMRGELNRRGIVPQADAGIAP
jgi:hypothetical protein